MKNNKFLIIISVILLNVLVVYVVGQSLLGKSSQYDKMLAEARSFAEQELCSKSIAKYNEALLTKDTLDVRLEMLDVYRKGIEIGEFTNTYDIFTSVTTMVDLYREMPKVYEAACEMLLEFEKYEECADILMKARDLHVTSDKISEYRNMVKYKYTKYFSMYTNVTPVFDGIYTVETNGEYSFLNSEVSSAVSGTFSYASSFANGYAFVKKQTADANGETTEERAFIINKNGERQSYLDGVEMSSGVGLAKNEKGDEILLVAGKKDKTYEYYDINGKKIFGEYQFAGRFRNNVAAVKEGDGKWKLINGQGKEIVQTAFEDIVLNEFDECAPKGFIFAKVDGQYHLYDLKGKQIGDLSCNGAKCFVDDYAAIMLNGVWGYVDTSGDIVIQPEYDDAKSFSNGMGAVLIGSSWHFINPQNEFVIEETFEDVGYLSDDGICFVKKDNYWSYLKTYYTGK